MAEEREGKKEEGSGSGEKREKERKPLYNFK